MSPVIKKLAMVSLCCLLFAGCSAKEPQQQGAKSAAVSVDSARDSQTAAPKTAPNSSSIQPTTVELATLLAEVPASIVPNNDVGCDKFVQWFLKKCKGLRFRDNWIVSHIQAGPGSSSGLYSRKVFFEVKRYTVNGIAVEFEPGIMMKGDLYPDYSAPFIYTGQITGEQATYVDSFKGKEVSVEGIICDCDASVRGMANFTVIFEDNVSTLVPVE